MTTRSKLGPLEREHKMTALPIDPPRHHAYIAGFNDGLKLADSKSSNAEIYDALKDLLAFAEVWQGSSVEITKARKALENYKTI